MKLQSEFLFTFDQNECGPVGNVIKEHLGGLFTEHAGVITVKCDTIAEFARMSNLTRANGPDEESSNTKFRQALSIALVDRIN